VLLFKDLKLEIIRRIKGFKLKPGIAKSLTSKLNTIVRRLNVGNVHGACVKLRSFVNEVNAQNGKRLSAAQAESLAQLAKKEEELKRAQQAGKDGRIRRLR